jgi:hypothetical protein
MQEYNNNYQQHEYENKLKVHQEAKKEFSSYIDQGYEMSEEVEALVWNHPRRMLVEFVQGDENIAEIIDKAREMALKTFAPPRPIRREDYGHLSDEQFVEEVGRLSLVNIQENPDLLKQVSRNYVDNHIMAIMLAKAAQKLRKYELRKGTPEVPAAETPKEAPSVTPVTNESGDYFGEEFDRMHKQYMARHGK